MGSDERRFSDVATLTSAAEALERWEGLPATDREAWLAELSRVNTPLADEVRSLSRYVEVRDGLDARGGPMVFAVGTESLPAIGSCVGEWTVERVIGKGGHGVVFLAQNASGRRVAIKFLREVLANTSARERFLKETATVKALSHEGIVGFVDAGEHNGLPYLVLEFVEGVDVRGYCATEKPSANRRVELCCNVLDALAYAHARGVVHRDVKPGNILVTRDGRVKLIDFGVARVEELQSRATRTGQQLGTTAYMSPEQLSFGAKDVTPASDVYAMGVVLYELLTGHLPYDPVLFAREPDRAIRLSTPLLPARWGGVSAQLPTALVDVVMRALRKEPNERYADAGEFANALRIIGRGGRVEPVWSRAAYGCRRFARRYGVLVAALVLAALIATWLATGRASAQQREAEAKQAVAWQSYLGTMQSATASYAKRDMAASRQFLAEVPERARGLEWRWLATLADPAPTVLRADREVWDLQGYEGGYFYSITGTLVHCGLQGNVRWSSNVSKMPVENFTITPSAIDGGDVVWMTDSKSLRVVRLLDGKVLESPYDKGEVVGGLTRWHDEVIFYHNDKFMTMSRGVEPHVFLQLPEKTRGSLATWDVATDIVVLATTPVRRSLQAERLVAGRIVDGAWVQLWQVDYAERGLTSLQIVERPSDGRRCLVAFDIGKYVTAYDLQTGEILVKMPEAPGGVWGAAIHADARTIALGCNSGHVAIATLDDTAWRFERRHRGLARVAWAGDVLLSGAWDKTLRRDDISYAQRVMHQPADAPMVWDMADGAIVAAWVNRDGVSMTIEDSSGRRLQTSLPTAATHMAIAGDAVWVGAYDGKVYKVDAKGDVNTTPVAIGGPVATIFAGTTGLVWISDVNGGCVVFDTATGVVTATAAGASKAPITTMVAEDDALHAVAVHIDGTIARIDRAGNATRVGTNASTTAQGVVHLKTQRIATLDADQSTLVVRDWKGKVRSQTQFGELAVTPAVFSPDGSRILVGFENGSIAIVAMPQGEVVMVLRICDAPIRDIVVRSDGVLIVLDAKARTWTVNPSDRLSVPEQVEETEDASVEEPPK